jgi:hypothetical protein
MAFFQITIKFYAPPFQQEVFISCICIQKYNPNYG